MTDGSLKLMETARISLSYTEMTSTLPWHQSVTAFCQWTILRGSYDALRSSVCSMLRVFMSVPDRLPRCQDADTLKRYFFKVVTAFDRSARRGAATMRR